MVRPHPPFSLSHSSSRPTPTGPEGTTVAETSVLSPLLPFAALTAALYYLQGTESYQEVRTWDESEKRSRAKDKNACAGLATQQRLWIYPPILLPQYPTLLLLGGGCATAKLTWKLIVGHMSASPLSQFDAVHIVPFLYVVFEILGLDSHTAMTLCCAIWLVDLGLSWKLGKN
jgi:hypothetical protein